ncbi:MAG: F0F1 ATP synthase subunit B [Eggerthellaceae bacterium]|nr:F0F1 ATP synthase subunit B [Eggerthellaceae bacterium]
MKKFGSKKTLALLVPPLVVLMPQLAFADGEGIKAILPNLQEFLPLLVAFIVLCFIFSKFGWPMFEKIMDERKKSIQEDLEAAEKAKKEAQRVLEENKKLLEQAIEESSKIQSTAKKSAEASRKEIIANATAQAEEIKKKADDNIDRKKTQVQSELKAYAVNLSISVVEKFVSRDLTDSEHRKIIEKYVDEMGPIDA